MALFNNNNNPLGAEGMIATDGSEVPFGGRGVGGGASGQRLMFESPPADGAQ